MRDTLRRWWRSITGGLLALVDAASRVDFVHTVLQNIVGRDVASFLQSIPLWAPITLLLLLIAWDYWRNHMGKDNAEKYPPASTVGRDQHQTGQFNVGGSIGNINNLVVNQQREEPRSDSEHIYQGGVIVGRVHGGRRSPMDATTFEFVEITHAQSFNYNEPFQYQGVTMQVRNIHSLTQLRAGRASDGTILEKVIAKVG